jgi:hypothetical protein
MVCSRFLGRLAAVADRSAQLRSGREVDLWSALIDFGGVAQADLVFTRQIGGGADTPTRLGEESIFASVFGDRSVELRAGSTVVGVSLYDGPGRLTQPLDSALLTAATTIANRTAR